METRPHRWSILHPLERANIRPTAYASVFHPSFPKEPHSSPEHNPDLLAVFSIYCHHHDEEQPGRHDVSKPSHNHQSQIRLGNEKEKKASRRPNEVRAVRMYSSTKATRCAFLRLVALTSSRAMKRPPEKQTSQPSMPCGRNPTQCDGTALPCNGSLLAVFPVQNLPRVKSQELYPPPLL